MLSGKISNKNTEINEEKNDIDYSQLDLSALKKIAGGIFSKGDPNAQYELGLCYAEGRKGAEDEDWKNSKKWFKKAADQDHAEAQAALAMVYLAHCKELERFNKKLLQKNFEQFIYWIDKAFKNDGYFAQFVYSMKYMRRYPAIDDCELETQRFMMNKRNEDYELAFNLTQQLLRNINNFGQHISRFELSQYVIYEALGSFYLLGVRVKRDITLALDFYLKARSVTLPEEIMTANLNFGFLFNYPISFVGGSSNNFFYNYEKVDGPVSIHATWDNFHILPAEIAEIDKLSNFMKQNDFDNLGCYYLSVYEKKHEEKENNPGAKAVEYLELAAAKNFSNSQYQLYRCYKLGLAGIKQDPIKACELLKKASRDNTEAIFELGTVYETGYGTIKIDFAEAMQCYLSAEIKHHIKASNAIDKLVKRQPSLASLAYKQQALNGNSSAQVNYGLLCLEEKNEKEAIKWFQKAVAQDNLDAYYHLAEYYEKSLDYFESAKYYRLAVAKGHANAKAALNNLYKQHILPILKSDNTLLSLNLQHINLEESDLLILTEILKTNTTLTQLDLRNTRIIRSHVDKLAGALKNRSIQLEILCSGGTVLVSAASPSSVLSSSSHSKNINNSNDDKISFSVALTIQYSEIKFGKEIGSGSFGVVYRGEWRKTPVAIKELRGNLQEDALIEFKNEVSIMEKLHSERLVRLYGVCLSPKYHLVMEYMSGGNLYNLLRGSKTLEWKICYQIVMDIACGLLFLHKENVLHRDIKSLNVLLDENFRAKLTDFGMSRIRKEATSIATTSDIVGTIPWMAPELFGPEPKYTKKSDIYSFGLTIWEVIARKRPFANAIPQAIPNLVCKGEREVIPSECPKRMTDLIQLCWKEKARDRPTIEEVIAHLEEETEASELSLRSGYLGNLATMKKYS